MLGLKYIWTRLYIFYPEINGRIFRSFRILLQAGFTLAFLVNFSHFLSLPDKVTHQMAKPHADQYCYIISAGVEDLLERPFALSPAAMSSLFRNLHCVGRGDYGQRYPQLFSRYVPGILPPMVESDLEAHIAETRELQGRLRAQGEAQGGADTMQQGQKRRGDDENYGPTFCVTVASQQQPPVLPDMFN